MKRFGFPLERVRLWRHTELELELARMAPLQAELAALHRRRRALADERAAAEAAVLGSGRIRPDELVALDAYRHWAEREDGRIGALADECVRRIEAQRARILEARRRAELLDRMKDRALAAWKTALDHEQEALAAELFMGRR